MDNERTHLWRFFLPLVFSFSCMGYGCNFRSIVYALGGRGHLNEPRQDDDNSEISSPRVLRAGMVDYPTETTCHPAYWGVDSPG